MPAQVEELEHRLEEHVIRLEAHVTRLEHYLTDQLELLRLALATRSARTAEHSDRVGESAGRLALAAGFSDKAADRLRLTAPLHDIGKISTPDAILDKPAPLTARERTLMQEHTITGARLLGASHAPMLELAASIALSHHEQWDGGGYPYGIVGEQIPVAARVTAVADVFDALTHERPYKEAWPIEESVAELERVAGSQLDPTLVEVFVRDCVPEPASPV